MLHDGEQLDVGESQPIHVLGEPGRNFAIAKRTVVLFRNAHPRAQVNLIDRHRRVQRVKRGTFFQKVRVTPGVVEIPHHGSRTGRLLVHEAERVSLIDLVAVPP